MKHFLLFYEVASDYLDRRPQFRAEHLKRAFRGDDKSVAEDFAKADPYVANGLVTRWYVREWTTVIGDLAATPVRPTPV